MDISHINDTLNGFEVKIEGKTLTFLFNQTSEPLSFAVANQMGQVISKGEVSADNHQIDLSGLKTGFYNLLVMRGLKRKIIPFKL